MAAKDETSKEEATASDTSTPKSTEESKSVVTVPPLIAAGKRLERLLGGKKTAAAAASRPTASSTSASAGAATTTTTTTTTQPHGLPGTGNAATLTSTVEAVLHSNPPKIVRRWLGTSSGAARDATLDDVVGAAGALLDPAGVAARGRDVLLALAPDAGNSGGSSSAAAATSSAMEVDGEEKKDGEEGGEGPTRPVYLVAAAREVEAYLLSLAIRLLLAADDADGVQKAWAVSGAALDILRGHMDAAARATIRAGAAGALGGDSASAGGAGGGLGSKGLEPLLARLYRYRCLVAEKCAVDTEALRSELVAAHRLACLRRDVDTQSTVLNLLLRELLAADQVEQANKLLSNSTFPDSASNNQLCRYLYHSGRIQALRLEYTSAFSNLSQCLRKSPTNTGLGFRIATQRLLVVVQLLMGEIPERTVFLTEGMHTELNPYMKITQAVRRGDLAVFHDTVSAFADRFKEDGTYTLISRLAHSVVKAGLRRLTGADGAYTRISLSDVANRLGLPSVESAEFVVTKAVRDGVIDATIDRAGQYVQSHDLVDVYATTEPAEAFHRRIAYCLTMHNDAVRGMRYPPDAYKKQLEASRGIIPKDDEDKTDEELAKELEDEMDEEY